MNIKRFIHWKPKSKSKGFTLLETLSATGIAAIVITSALSIVASIYFSQRRVQFSHDFYAEGRFLMERMAQTIRNNTIDYDRFFIEMGPGATKCTSFNTQQVPNGASIQNNNADEAINQSNRAALGYNTIFYWDTNGDSEQDRNLGGKKPNGTDDDECSTAWDRDLNLNTLYLINSARTLRTALYYNGSNDTIEIERQLTADTDNDGTGDIWGPFDANGDGDLIDPGSSSDVGLQWDTSQARCELLYDKDGDNIFEEYPILGDSTNEDFCDRGHESTTISPVAIKVNALLFEPAPNRDPYLSFRIDDSQVHPHVFISIDTELRNPDQYGFDSAGLPTLSFQTAVSSRVFGNIRR